MPTFLGIGDFRSSQPGLLQTLLDHDVPDFDLVLEQSADGSWHLTSELARLCGQSLRKLERTAAKELDGVDEAKKLLATLLALVLLEGRAQKSPETVGRVVTKAEEWVAGVTRGLSPPEPHASWVEWARQYVKDKVTSPDKKA